MDAALEERLLPSRGEHTVHRLARVGQPEGEQIAGHQLAGQLHRHVAEVDLGLHPELVRLRDERLDRGLARLHQDLRLAVRDVAADLLVGDLGAVLGDQAVEDPGGRVPLLARRVQISPQDPVDHDLVRVHRARPGRELLPRLRPDRVHGLPDRPPRHVVLARDLAQLHAAAVVAPDRGVQLDLRHLRHDQGLSPGALPMRAWQVPR
ncbi:hypothetical protein [Kitasatospora sp. NA04385]|uniref:hypothetical protein n=1 Tax=Kitasatospora sp. NA04385 TaxID=2742135 RepID=UPI0020CB1431|nr:hypothetical protein [Kitasatospora sp. NA04385]